MFSTVARAVKAPEAHIKPPLEGSWYSYWSGVPMKGWHLWLRPQRVIFAYNPNANLALIGAAFAVKDVPAVRKDVESHYMQALAEHAPELFERMKTGRREGRFVGGAIPSYVRKPYAPGSPLPGYPAYHTDPTPP